MLRFGIIGFPLEHTLSPVMQTAALQQLNRLGEFKAYEVKEEDLKKVFEELKQKGGTGLSVTIPHKTKIISFIDKLSTKAKLANAVNTVKIEKDGTISGDNTDIVGFWDALDEDFKKKLKNHNVSVLGCGGACRAVCLALLENNVKNLKVYGRNKEKLEAYKVFLLNTKEKLKSKTNIEIDLLDKVDFSQSALLVNTTPVGMHPNVDNSPLPIENLQALPKDALVYDIIYNPSETKLLKDAKSLNLKILNGIEMLARQGQAALSIWLDEEVSALVAMRTAIEDSLQTTANPPTKI